MKFDLKKSECDKLSTLKNMCQSIISSSINEDSYVFKLEPDKLYVSVYGQGNALQFYVEVSNVVLAEDESPYFNDKLDNIIINATKIYKTTKSEVVTFEIENQKCNVYNGKPHILTAMKAINSEEELEEAHLAIETKKSVFNADDLTTLNYGLVCDDVISFMNIASTSINLAGVDRVSGIAMEGERIKYCDQSFSIIDYNANKILTPNNVKVYIPKNLFPIMSALHKINGDFTFSLNEDSSFIYIDTPSINFKAILVMPSVLCEYPEEEQLEAFNPTESDSFKFTISTDEINNKMALFEGLFPAANWKYKTIDFTIDNSGVLNFHYEKINLGIQVDTDVDITNYSATSSETEYTFKVPTIVLREYLDNLNKKNEDINVTVTPREPSFTEDNSLGIKFNFGDVELTICKLLSEESY